MKSVLSIFGLLTLSLGAFAADNVAALKRALDDEYRAQATYLQVIQDFGRVRPFVKILSAEERHIKALLPFFDKYNVRIPVNPYIGEVPSFSSVGQACSVGVEAEIANRDLYEDLYKMADDPELISVFENLQWASEYRHLPAFQKCARTSL